MISRNSFLDRCKQNNKRRNWSWFVDTIALVMMISFPMLIGMNGEQNRNISSGLQAREQLKAMQNMAASLLGFRVMTAIVIMVLAVFTAIQGYSYLQNKRKVDMYQSQPVSNRKRFFSIYLNGIFCFLIPYAVSVLLAFVVAVSYHAVNTTVVLTMFLNFFMNVLFYMCVYAATILIVMITGNLFATVLGTGIILVYGAVWEMIIVLFTTGFFYTYSYLQSYIESSTNYSYLMDRVGLKSGGLSVAGYFVFLQNMIQAEHGPFCGKIVKICLLLLFFIVVLTSVSYYAFDKRKAESVGMSIVFPKLKKWIEPLVVVPSALLLTKFIGNSAGDSGLFYGIGLVVSVILAHLLTQLIFERNMGSILKKWPDFLLSFAIVAIIFCGYYFDLTGYDSYVPKEEELASAAIIVGNSGFEYCDLDNGEKMTSFEKYQMDEMQITDVKTVRELSLANYFYQNKGKWQNHVKMMREQIKDKVYYALNIKYRLKNGREIFREIYVDANACEALLNKVVGSEEFKKAYFQITDDRWISNEKLRIHSYVAVAGRMHKIEPEDFAMLRKLYLKDLEQFDFSMAKNSIPVAEWFLSASETEEPAGENQCYIYPEFVNTIEFLKKQGIPLTDEWNTEDIRQISVYHYDSNYVNSKQQSYEDPAEMEQIVKVLQPGNLGREWTYESEPDTDYWDIYIQFVDPRMDSYFYIKKGETLPDFVIEDLPSF